MTHYPQQPPQPGRPSPQQGPHPQGPPRPHHPHQYGPPRQPQVPHQRPPKPIYRRPWIIGLAALLLLIIAAWLTPTGDETPPTTPTTSAPTTGAAPTAERPAGCLAVPEAVALAILDGVPDGDAAAAGLTLTDAQALPYSGPVTVVETGAQFPAGDRYLVAVSWSGPSTGTGVWLVASIDAPGQTMTVDSAAANLTAWPRVQVDADPAEATSCL